MRIPDAPIAGFLARCLAACVLMVAVSAARAEARADCHIGSYRLADDTLVDVAPSDGATLRWRRFNGETGALHRMANGVWSSIAGWTKHSDGVSVIFPNCNAGRIDFNGIWGQRIRLDVRNVSFRSHDVALAGRLILPRGSDRVPVVVLVHGAEHDSALIDYYLQRMLPAEGIGAFVYDKRGTGKSGGHYTQDFELLADDANAAVATARRLAGVRLGRIGFQAGSEGGWVAPIAANRAHVDFVIVCFGLAVSVIAEDQQGVELQMREKGYPPEVIAEAQKVAGAAEAVIASDFKQGFPQLDEMRAKYGKAHWYKDVHGDYTWFVLGHSDAQLRAAAKEFDWHTPFDYDPMPTLRAGRVPQLWIVGGEDYEAPSAATSRRIKSLIAGGLPFTLAYYPHAEHGMTLFEAQADGTRLSTRYAPGYFGMIRDFALLGHLPGTYGDADITRPPSSAEASPTTPPTGSQASSGDAHGESMTATPQSRGTYRLPFADGTQVKVFDDFTTHRPRGRVDLYAIAGSKPYRIVAAAAGRIVAIEDGYGEQQSGRAAALCHNNYVWIAHPNGEWTNYSHVAHDSVSGKAHLKVGDRVKAGQYIGDEGAVGCAMLEHVHFEVAVPDSAHPIDSGGFLTGNDGGKRELNPRFCGVPGCNAVKGKAYRAVSCR